MNKSEKKLEQNPEKVTPQKTARVLPFDDGSKKIKKN
jgi:hypothetical protein